MNKDHFKDVIRTYKLFIIVITLVVVVVVIQKQT